MQDIWSEIITKEMAVLAAGVVAVMTFVGRIPIKNGTKNLNEMPWWKRWGIFIMFGLTVAGSFTPGVHNIPYKNWGGILIFAFTTAMVALLGRAVLKPLILERLEGKEKNGV